MTTTTRRYRYTVYKIWRGDWAVWEHDDNAGRGRPVPGSFRDTREAARDLAAELTEAARQ